MGKKKHLYLQIHKVLGKSSIEVQERFPADQHLSSSIYTHKQDPKARVDLSYVEGWPRVAKTDNDAGKIPCYSWVPPTSSFLPYALGVLSNLLLDSYQEQTLNNYSMLRPHVSRSSPQKGEYRNVYAKFKRFFIIKTWIKF